MTDVHTNGRVTHPDRQTLAAAEATQIRLASYLPDDVDDGVVRATSTWDDVETLPEWRRFVRLGVLTGVLTGVLVVLGVIVATLLVAVGSGVLGS
jgi:hypothetical protein